MSEKMKLGDMPAYPMASGDEPRVDKTTHYNEGMTLRQHYAGLAMQGLLTNYEVHKDICNNDPRYKKQPDGQYNFAHVVALNAIEFADALLAELEKSHEI